MDKKKDIATLIEEAVDEMRKFGNTPHVIICSKKAWQKVTLYFRKQSPIEEKFMPLQIWFKYDFGDLPVLKFKYLPEDTIYVLDKSTYEKLMKQTKGKFAMSYFEKYPCELLKSGKTEPRKLKTATYKRKGLYYDFGEKTIIKRIG